MGIFDVQLLQAMEENNVGVAKSLVCKISDVNYQIMSRHSALHSAVLHNALEIAQLLLEQGANMLLMPRNKTYENKHECPLIMAFKMGESREAMQILLIDALRSECQPLTWGDKELQKIKMLSHYAILYSSPAAFYATIAHDGDANVRNCDDMTPLMYVLRDVTNFEKDVDVCRVKMQNVREIVCKHPEMLWKRYCREATERGRPCVCDKDKSTALGMLFFETISGRTSRTAVDVAYYDSQENDPATTCNMMMLGERIARNQGVLFFFQCDFMPSLFESMLQQMRLALAMATHSRLGQSAKCGIAVLGADAIKTVFDVLMSSLTCDEKEFMLC